MAKPDYQEAYDEFMDSYKSGDISGEKVGELIAKLTQYYMKYNLDLAIADHSYRDVAADVSQEVDENSGKTIAQTKADIKTAATGEAKDVTEYKIHLSNIEQCINSLKSLQKGILNEYSHMGGS